MAVMATEAPLEKMAFNEKAHQIPETEMLSVDVEMSSTNNYNNATFDAPVTQNGTHLNLMDTRNSILEDPNSVASETVTGGDAIAAPVTHVSSGIEPIASFLSETTAESLAGASDLPATTTLLPPVEQPISDFRSEPLPSELPETADAVNGEELDSERLEAIGINASANSMGVTSTAQNPSTEDMMDTTEDTAVAAAVPSAETPLPTTENTTIEDAPVTESNTNKSFEADTSMVDSSALPEASSGQVRQREEEDDEEEPSAKRAKTETAEGSPETIAPAATSVEAPPASGEPANGDTTAPMTTAPSMSAPPPQWDTNPLTPIQHKYLIEQVRKAKKIKFGQWFLKPVDPVALNIPTYPEIIKNPMDLGTLEEKLKKHEYDNASAFMADFDLIIDNCLRFNGPTHSVAQMAINLRAYFNKNISLMPTGDAAKPPVQQAKAPKAPAKPIVVAKPTPPRPERVKPPVVAKSPVESNPGPFVDGNGMPIIRRKSGPDPDGPAGDRPKRAIHPPKRDLPHSGSKPKKKKHQVELKFCEQIVSKLFNKKHATFAYPFLHPVDPVALNIPNYHKIIKKPMDFTTIQANLKSSQYANAKEFLLDARQVFLNCYKFNPTTDNVYRMGKQTEELFDSLWKEKDQYVLDNTPASEPPSDAEDEDEEEDEDEDEENGTNEKAFEAAKSSRILELQQQIAKLSQEVVTLATSSYSPKASAKKIKTKPPKTKRASVAAAPLKPAKTKAKTTKVRKLTLDQKREVSEGIANLDEGQMRRAVQIIRNGVPHLRDVHDDELELDIDEIPDVVVLELYDFVRKLRPRGAVQEPDDDEYTEPDTVHKPASVNRKKNKPMKAVEQEERIQKLEAQLNKFKNTSGSEQSPAEHNQDDSSGDEGAESESSEEE